MGGCPAGSAARTQCPLAGDLPVPHTPIPQRSHVACPSPCAPSFLTPDEGQLVRVLFDAISAPVGRYMFMDIASMMRHFKPFADAKVLWGAMGCCGVPTVAGLRCCCCCCVSPVCHTSTPSVPFPTHPTRTRLRLPTHALMHTPTQPLCHAQGVSAFAPLSVYVHVRGRRTPCCSCTSSIGRWRRWSSLGHGCTPAKTASCSPLWSSTASAGEPTYSI